MNEADSVAGEQDWNRLGFRVQGVLAGFCWQVGEAGVSGRVSWIILCSKHEVWW